MKSVTVKKPQKLKVVSFNEFVEYVKKNSREPHWHTYLYGVSITHENDSHYILMPENGQVDFRRGQLLCIREDFSMFIITETDFKHQLKMLMLNYEMDTKTGDFIEYKLP